MNTKVSGAQLVLVPIKNVGRNFFPYVEHIAKRAIKYIDFAPAALLPRITAPGLQSTQNMFITIMDENGTKELHKRLPLERLDYSQTIGVRTPICKRINMDSCYIDCQDASQVGKVAALVFWYDLPEYSAKNTTDNIMTDAIEIPITNVQQYNPLPDSDRLTGKRFRKLLLGKPSVTPDGNTGLGDDELQNAYLTLQKGSYKVLADVPVFLLYQLAMLEKMEFANIIFDFQSSFVTIGGAGTATQDDYVGKYVFMNLQYEA